MTDTSPERTTPEQDQGKKQTTDTAGGSQQQRSDAPKATPTADPNVDPANDWPAA
ncbi:hypothetical protein ACLE20_11260 [Rhizobium sp. YIM 134829]|uniref:hypothetical protein n=1 Tax=Rhizobium sp. YIM 134829 TaxID=3390453 RepID=UPI00397DD581